MASCKQRGFSGLRRCIANPTVVSDESVHAEQPDGPLEGIDGHHQMLAADASSAFIISRSVWHQ